MSEEIKRYTIVGDDFEAVSDATGKWVRNDAAQSQLAALREELVKAKEWASQYAELEVVFHSERDIWQRESTANSKAHGEIQQRLADAERRNGEHISMLKHFANLADVRNVGTHAMDYVSALNPNPEAAANEPTCTCWLQPQEPQCTNCPNKSRGRKP